MKKKENYIKVVLIVFGLLIISRISSFIHGELDGELVVSTLVELALFIWGVLILIRPPVNKATLK